MLSSSMGVLRLETSTCRFSAKDTALLTRPSNSAPLKFLVRAAQQGGHVSGGELSFRLKGGRTGFNF
jgi:hypothetical protein